MNEKTSLVGLPPEDTSSGKSCFRRTYLPGKACREDAVFRHHGCPPSDPRLSSLNHLHTHHHRSIEYQVSGQPINPSLVTQERAIKEKLEKGKLAPLDMFRNELYTAWDATGLPTTDAKREMVIAPASFHPALLGPPMAPGCTSHPACQCRAT